MDKNLYQKKSMDKIFKYLFFPLVNTYFSSKSSISVSIAKIITLMLDGLYIYLLEDIEITSKESNL